MSRDLSKRLLAMSEGVPLNAVPCTIVTTSPLTVDVHGATVAGVGFFDTAYYVPGNPAVAFTGDGITYMIFPLA